MTIRETSACPFCGQAHSGTACNHALDSLDMEDHGHLINEATGEIGKLQSEITRLERELAEARKEKVCQCDDYEKEMKHIDSFFVLGYVHGMKFTGKQFAYCPYCGGRIEE